MDPEELGTRQDPAQQNSICYILIVEGEKGKVNGKIQGQAAPKDNMDHSLCRRPFTEAFWDSRGCQKYGRRKVRSPWRRLHNCMKIARVPQIHGLKITSRLIKTSVITITFERLGVNRTGEFPLFRT